MDQAMGGRRWMFSPRQACLMISWMFLCACSCMQRADGLTNSNDANALLALQDALGAAAILEWNGDDPCGSHWVGVTCDGSSTAPQRVTSLVLTALSLQGQLPSDIGMLTALETLDLSSNNISGTLPQLLGSLTSLVSLVLESNLLSGTIPPALGQLRNLSYLYLNGNSLSGSIPHELGLLTKLYWLDLAFNKLEGALPYSSDGNSQANAGLDNLTNAGHFHLNNNNFDGTIPAPIFHPGMVLIHLLLDSNQFSGQIPKELGQLRHLLIMKIDNNKLRGAIPIEFNQLVSLNVLQVSSNQLSGPLPDLSTLTALQVLSLSNNSFADVRLPSWLANLTSLTDMDMQNAELSGGIPAAFFSLPALSVVKLDNNQINGTVDLSNTGSQLLLVSLENNAITSVNPGQNTGLTLLLQGNPACTNSLLNPKLCAQPTSPPPSSDLNGNGCSNLCPSGMMANPLDCSCGVPFQGTFTFRAPSFTTTVNASKIESFISALAKLVNVTAKQVEVPLDSFNAQSQLIIKVLIFTSGSVRWTLDDILRMTTVILDPGIDVYGFGPSMFKADPYPIGGVNTSGSGLSSMAKIGIAVGASVLVLVVIAVCIFAMLQKRRADKALELSKTFASWGGMSGDSGGAPKLKGARWFSYSELKKATNNFSASNEIGSGGYGKVYKGVLLNGEVVAIKRAQENSMQGATEFKNEIELLSRVHHKNVVVLIGFYFEQGEQMLVYEYMSFGTLRENLVGRNSVKLDWRRRLMIALGAARGIAYLHELVNPPIIHRDIKSTNILLDEKKIAKVADFGLSKIGPSEGSEKGHVSTQVKGTLGYLDPEYYLTQQLSEKSDVYSYGVVLLELITARQPIERGKYVVREVKEVLEKGGMSALRAKLDPRIKDENLLELEKLVSIALSCVEESAANRPMMGDVVKDLEDLVGNDQSEPGSSSIDVGKGQPRHPYASDSDFMHTSRESSDPSFQYSGGFVSPTGNSK